MKRGGGEGGKELIEGQEKKVSKKTSKVEEMKEEEL